MIKLIAKNKITQTFLQKYKLTFCQFKRANSSFYPYKFGGLSAQKISHLKASSNNEIMQFIFGRQILNNFCSAYRQYVKSLHQRDSDYLKEILQRNLTRNMQFKNTKLVNPQAKIVPIVGKFNIVTGGCFDRSILSKYQIVTLVSSEEKLLNAYGAVNQNQRATQKVLFCFHVYFKSIMKLVNQESFENKQIDLQLKEKQIKQMQQEQNRQQIHMMQFEFENTISKKEIIMKGIPIILKNLFNRTKMYRELMLLIMGANKTSFEWKVGDVDQTLQGNLVNQN